MEILAQAHKEIKKAVEQRNLAQAMELLERCQEGAIELGNLIEVEEGEQFPTVRLLEGYCERLYQFHEKLRLGASSDGLKEHKVLQKSLIAIENSIKNDISVRTEVVFLPYKASMWDSLESVWEKAKEDLRCDAYVIPIPYYDRNPDRSFGKMHYEGDLYPDAVPVVWYEDYDFEKRRPDVIYIHNPYDGCNSVTSVHPFFYSDNLKRFTEQLVYIPYFVLGEVEPENKAVVEGIKHFCLVPGVFHADKVIVQSENMRQIYIDVLTEYAANEKKDKNLTEIRKHYENKIDGSGSPKFDKALNTKREDLEIPPEWKKALEKPDGSRKKVIFYNTSIGAFLHYNERYLEKMWNVFRTFFENREQVALLWRPHPLLKETIESMRPALGQAYEEIVRLYREEGWGIYDDTADFNRAIALCDAYYGDWSSVVALCQKVGKPIMIQNIELLNGAEERAN